VRIVADHVYVNDDAGTVLSAGVVEVDAGSITAVEPVREARPRGEGVIDLGESILMPGLVNAHAHTPMSLMRGVSEGHSLLTLDGWLGAIRSLEAHLTPELVPASVAVSCAEMIASGTTAFADQYFFAERYLAVIKDSGLRATVAYGIVELGDDDARAAGLAAAGAFLEDAGDDPLVRGWIGPHAFFVDNQLDAIDAEIAMAKRHDVGLHTHFGTSAEEEEACRRDYGRSALSMMHEIGLFDVPLLLAHCNAIARDELGLLAGTRATIVPAASVAMISGAAAPPVREALDSGVNVALGTDNWCGNNNADLFEEMRTLGKLAAFTARAPNPIPPRELIGLATWRGHRALGASDDDGRLVGGAVADLVALPVAALHRGPVGAQDIASALVYGASGFASTEVMTAGRWLKRGGVLTTVDLAAARAQQQLDYDELMARVHAA